MSAILQKINQSDAYRMHRINPRRRSRSETSPAGRVERQCVVVGVDERISGEQGLTTS